MTEEPDLAPEPGCPDCGHRDLHAEYARLQADYRVEYRTHAQALIDQLRTKDAEIKRLRDENATYRQDCGDWAATATRTKLEDEPTLEAMAARIKAGGYRQVGTFRPQGPGDIFEVVWSRPSRTLDLDWYQLTHRFGDRWMAELARLLNDGGTD